MVARPRAAPKASITWPTLQNFWPAITKSPLTGGWGDANCGGKLSPAIKACGVDGIFFSGISEKPVYLRVFGDKAELVDASHLWGKTTKETEALVRRLNQPKAPARREAVDEDPDVRRLLSDLTERLGAKVALQQGSGGKGRLVISYNNLEELEGILDHIR